VSDAEDLGQAEGKKPGAVTSMIRQDAALRLLERSQKDHVELLKAHNKDLRDDVQSGFKTMNRLLFLFAFLYLVQTLIFAALVGIKGKVDVPDTLGGGSVEVTPGK
jgi:hypothetical protein